MRPVGQEGLNPGLAVGSSRRLLVEQGGSPVSSETAIECWSRSIAMWLPRAWCCWLNRTGKWSSAFRNLCQSLLTKNLWPILTSSAQEEEPLCGCL